MELERTAALLVREPRDRDLFLRALEAAAVARRGLELLHEVAEFVEEMHPFSRPVDNPLLLRSGNPLLDPEGGEVRTDLLDEALEEIRFALAAGSATDMADILGGLTEGGLRRKIASSLVEALQALPDEERAHLNESVRGWPEDINTSYISRIAEAMMPEPDGTRADRLQFAGDRLRDAEALLAVGRGMLYEVAELLPPAGVLTSPSAVVEPQSFTPGAWVRLGVAVPTDPLELLGYEVAAIMASEAGKLEDVAQQLATLTKNLDVRGRPMGVLRAYLSPDVAGELAARLAVESDMLRNAPPIRPAAPRVNIGQLRRALLKVPMRHTTIEDAWETLAGEGRPWARRWAAGVQLLRFTREIVRDDPRKAAAWAAQAGRAAQALAAPGGFAGRMADLLATFASAHAGNAFRVQGQLTVADRFFLPFEEDDHLGLRAEYLALKATLRRAQRRPIEAIELLEEADRMASRGGFPGSRDLLAQIRIAHARTLTALSEFDAAAMILRTSLGARMPSRPDRALPPEGELSPRLRWIALQNLADCLSKAGELEAAEEALADAESLATTMTLPEADLLRTQWVKARLSSRGRAGFERGEALGYVRERLIGSGLIYDAALASLELAEWHAEAIAEGGEAERHLAAIRELASESAMFFAGQDVGPEAMAAIALFQFVSTVARPEPSSIRKIERLLRQAAMS